MGKQRLKRPAVRDPREVDDTFFPAQEADRAWELGRSEQELIVGAAGPATGYFPDVVCESFAIPKRRASKLYHPYLSGPSKIPQPAVKW